VIEAADHERLFAKTEGQSAGQKFIVPDNHRREPMNRCFAGRRRGEMASPPKLRNRIAGAAVSGYRETGRFVTAASDRGSNSMRERSSSKCRIRAWSLEPEARRLTPAGGGSLTDFRDAALVADLVLRTATRLIENPADSTRRVFLAAGLPPGAEALNACLVKGASLTSSNRENRQPRTGLEQR